MDERERASFERLVLGALNWMLGKLLDPNNKEDMEYYKDWAMRLGEYLDRRNQSGPPMSEYQYDFIEPKIVGTLECLPKGEIAKLRAENERLRAALQNIAIGCGEDILSQDGMRARAFAALND